MKTILLMRHSIPERLDLPTEKLPLTKEGKILALETKEKLQSFHINKCFSSPYLRAYETANIICDEVNIIHGIHERIIGNAKEDFWLKQYTDYNYKNENGESLNEVKIRMNYAINEVLNQMNENETALVISHGTAISSYLLNFCDLKVIDSKTKSRKIVFNNNEILSGKINPTNYFIIQYENSKVISIQFVN